MKSVRDGRRISPCHFLDGTFGVEKITSSEVYVRDLSDPLRDDMRLEGGE